MLWPNVWIRISLARCLDRMHGPISAGPNALGYSFDREHMFPCMANPQRRRLRVGLLVPQAAAAEPFRGWPFLAGERAPIESWVEGKGSMLPEGERMGCCID